MMRKNFFRYTLITAIGFSLTIAGCKKDKEDTEADKQLYNESIASGFTYYQSAATLSAASPSPHGSFKLKVNATAAAVLDSLGELPAGSTFPSGSIIVKEVQSGGATSIYAVMKKDPSNENAGSGWLWAEYNTDGSTVFSITKKGDGCISCHSGTPNRDLVRTYDLH